MTHSFPTLRSSDLVGLIDLYPTVAELADLSASPHVQGQSLVTTLDKPAHQVRDMAFAVSTNGKKLGEAFLVRTGKWSYIQYGEDAAEGMELYDMEYDSKQYNNLARLPKYQTMVEKLRLQLKIGNASCRDSVCKYV